MPCQSRADPTQQCRAPLDARRKGPRSFLCIINGHCFDPHKSSEWTDTPGEFTHVLNTESTLLASAGSEALCTSARAHPGCPARELEGGLYCTRGPPWSVLRGIMASEDVHVLIPRTRGCVRSHSVRVLQVRLVKDFEMGRSPSALWGGAQESREPRSREASPARHRLRQQGEAWGAHVRPVTPGSKDGRDQEPGRERGLQEVRITAA